METAISIHDAQYALDLVKKICTEVGPGLPATLGTASDAGPFSRAGLKATTLNPFKISQQIVAYYHQKWDTPEVLTLEPLYNVLKLTFEWIRSSEGQGEPHFDKSRVSISAKRRA